MGNTSLLKGGHVVVSAYNESEQASVTWVCTKAIPGDADKNWLYQNRQAWWGDDSEWKNANIAADPSDPTKVVVTLPAGVHAASLTAIKYGHQSPKGSPQ